MQTYGHALYVLGGGGRLRQDAQLNRHGLSETT
jgi:hypothetical protein